MSVERAVSMAEAGSGGPCRSSTRHALQCSTKVDTRALTVTEWRPQPRELQPG